MRRSILFLMVVILAAAGGLAAQSNAGLTRATHLLTPPPPQHRQHPPKPLPPIGAPAILDASAMGSPVLLDTCWRVGISADPAAAQPDFDDSAWALRNATDAFPDVAEPDVDEGNNANEADRTEASLRRIKGAENQRLYAWFRIHIQLPAHHGPVALLVELPVSHNTSISIGSGPGFDVFANGRHIQPEGPNGQNPDSYQPITRIYPLAVDASQTSVVLVVRTIYLPLGLGSYTHFFSGRKLILGDPRSLNHSLEGWRNRVLFERIPRLVMAILLVALANFLLALYFGQKGHREYLWLALHELAQAPIAFFELAGSTARIDSLWYTAANAQLLLLSAYLYFEFLVAFLSLPGRRWYVRLLRFTSPVLLMVGPSVLMVGHSTAAGLVLVLTGICSTFWLLGWLVFVVFTLISAALKRNFEAALLLVPLVLNCVGSIEPVFTVAMSDITGHPVHSPLTFEAGPVPITFASIADSVGIFVIVLIIFFRFLRIQRNQERASSELAAARSVQELIIPREKIATPGFEVDSVYTPANEVGGDFYYVQPIAGGGLLVVLGDVAGKGLKAAMNVSILVGALRQMDAQCSAAPPKPSRILTELNRVLTGSESFTTCQAAYFGPEGELTLASAGHLPPYLNSQEIEMPGGLPLGIVPEMNYEEVQLFLHPGDRLLLLSDGVVEARRPSGELFGFDRVHNLSNQSAFYIADAARSFGQEDDITVLAVRRLERSEAV